jgi:ribonuclease P protein component
VRAYDSLRRRADFARTTRRGKRSSSPHLACYVADGRRRTRIGITVGGTVGGAVIRNRVRRRIKSILDRYPLGRPPWRDVVFIARPGAGELTFEALVDEIGRVFGSR